MIATKYRVPKESIPYLLRKGAQSHSGLFIVRSAQNDLDFSRFRVIVSKKLHKEAVDRNKLRRQIYEIIRTNEAKLPKKHDIILIPKKQILKKGFETIQKDICSIEFSSTQ